MEKRGATRAERTWRRKLLTSASAFSCAALLAGPARAVDVTAVSDHVRGQFGAIADLFLAGCFIVGLLVVAQGLYMAKTFGVWQQASQDEMSRVRPTAILGKIAVGIALVGLPSIIWATAGTFGLGDPSTGAGAIKGNTAIERAWD